MINLAIVGAILGGIPIILRYPFAGIIFWYWVSIMNPHRLSWGFAYDFPVAMVIGATAIGAYLVSRERKSLPTDTTTILLILLTLWVTLTTVFAANPDDAWGKWDRTIKILVMTFLTIAMVTNRVRLHAVIWVLALSLGFYMLKGGVFTLIRGADDLVWGPPQSFLADNNQFAMALLMAAPFVRYLQVMSAHRAVRIAFGATLVIGAIAVIGTYSRGAFLAMIAVGAFLTLRSHYKVQVGFLVLIVAAIAFVITPIEWVNRIESIANYEQDASAVGRFDAWTFAWRYALDHPILGGGFLVNIDPNIFYQYVPNAITARAMHSIYFEVLGEHGFVGFGLFMALLGSTWRGFAQVRRTCRDSAAWARDLAGLGQVSLVAYATAGVFYNLAFFDLFYLVVAMQVGLCQSVSHNSEVAAADGTFFGETRRPMQYTEPGSPKLGRRIDSASHVR